MLDRYGLGTISDGNFVAFRAWRLVRRGDRAAGRVRAAEAGRCDDINPTLEHHDLSS
jgi:hypothetical protein